MTALTLNFLICWIPWTVRRSNQSILKEINPEYSLEGLMMKLKLQNFGHLLRSADSLEKTLMLGKIENRRKGQRGWDYWKASPTQWTRVWASSKRWWRTGKPGVLQSIGLQKVRHVWTITNPKVPFSTDILSHNICPVYVRVMLMPSCSLLNVRR